MKTKMTVELEIDHDTLTPEAAKNAVANALNDPRWKKVPFAIDGETDEEVFVQLVKEIK